MYILKTESPIQFALIDNKNSCIYEETNSGVPKHVAAIIEQGKVGGAGAHLDDYFISNTSGITSGKVFHKVKEGFVFTPVRHEQLIELNNVDTISALDRTIELVGDDLRFVVFTIDGHRDHGFSIHANYEFDSNALICNDDSSFSQYKELFRGRHKYGIGVNAIVDREDESDMEQYNRTMTIRELRDELNDLSLRNSACVYYDLEDKQYQPNQSLIESINE